MKNLRFWQKTYLLTLLLFLLALFGGIIFIGWQNQRQMMAREIEKAKSEQHFVAQSLSRDLAAIQGNVHLRVPALARSYGRYYAQDGVLMELKHEGETIFSSLPATAGEQPELVAAKGMQSWTTRSLGGVQHSLVASALQDGYEGYTLVCARSLEPLTQSWAQMRSTLAVGGAGVSAVLAVGLFFILRSLSKPLERLAGVADEFAGGNFGVRAVAPGNDEIGNLAASLNAMADAVQQKIVEIRQTAEQNARMAANLSHEIRTPLTAIQGYAEYMRLAGLTGEEQASALGYIVEESARLQKISQRMLQLSALEHDEIKMTPQELDAIVRRVSRSLGPKARRARVGLEIQPLPGMLVLGDGILLESLITNLLDNAIKACAKDGQVRLLARRAEEKIVVTVADNGCGLQANELDKLGEAFYRPDRARSRRDGGAGLGVALCRQIAGLHKAALHYASVPKKGTTVTLEFTAL